MTRADRPGLVAAVTLLLAVLLAGCSGGASEPDAEPRPSQSDSDPRDAGRVPEIRSYVALGDSFTAAPLVPGTQFAEGCFRSSGNYPTRLAEELGAKLRDVSCGGADTGDMTGRQVVRVDDSANRVPPQLNAVRPGTDLVTVGIGGNDEGLFATLVRECTAAADPGGPSCASVLRDSYGDPRNVFELVQRRVTGVLEQVRRKAPDAVVVLVGYPRLVDEDRSCRAMPLARTDVPLVARLEALLNRTLARAAQSAGAEYLDMYAASDGHEICSKDPWVNGRVTDQQRALSYHPFPEGQQAVADRLLALLSRS